MQARGKMPTAVSNGHHSAAAVIAMIYLCCSGRTITLPTGR
jgi:hypothetical protein